MAARAPWSNSGAFEGRSPTRGGPPAWRAVAVEAPRAPPRSTRKGPRSTKAPGDAVQTLATLSTTWHDATAFRRFVVHAPAGASLRTVGRLAERMRAAGHVCARVIGEPVKVSRVNLSAGPGRGLRDRHHSTQGGDSASWGDRT